MLTCHISIVCTQTMIISFLSMTIACNDICEQCWGHLEGATIRNVMLGCILLRYIFILRHIFEITLF